MNKYAAEKIASEYYNLGVQLALQGPGLTKTASGEAFMLRKLLGGTLNTASAAGAAAAGTGLGALGGKLTQEMLPQLKSLAGVDDLAMYLAAGAGGLKGVQQAVRMRTPEIVWKEPGLLDGGFRLRPRA